MIVDKNSLSEANTLSYKHGTENTAHGPPGKHTVQQSVQKRGSYVGKVRVCNM